MRFHLFPFRTEKLSSLTPMVLRFSRGRVGSRLFKPDPKGSGFLFAYCRAKNGGQPECCPPLTPFSPLLRLRHEWFEFFGGVLLYKDSNFPPPANFSLIN